MVYSPLSLSDRLAKRIVLFVKGLIFSSGVIDKNRYVINKNNLVSLSHWAMELSAASHLFYLPSLGSLCCFLNLLYSTFNTLLAS